MRRRLPAARVALRPRERDPDDAAGVRGGRDVSRSPCATTASSSSRCPTDARRARARRARPARGGGRRRARGRPSRGAALAPGRADDGPLPVRARRVPGRHRGARDRRLARVLVDLARRRRARSRRPSRLARARSGEVRGVARRTSPTPASRSGPSSSRATRTRRSQRPRTSSTSSSSTPRRTTTRTLFALARPLLEPGGLVVADNVLSHAETLGAYSAARQADPTLVERHRAARPRARAVGRPRPTCLEPCSRGAARTSSRRFLHPLEVRMLALPRKGGGPA